MRSSAASDVYKRQMYYSIIKRFYDLGVYSLAKVRDFVGAGVISPEQFKEITKEVYHETEVSEAD